LTCSFFCVKIPIMNRKEHSFGIIPLRKVGKTFEVLLVKHQAGHWAFPKGHAEIHETPQETAERELFEEVGLKVDKWILTAPLEESYTFQKMDDLISKAVTYFPAFVTGLLNLREAEISDAKWLSLEDAETLCTFPPSKALCEMLKQSCPSYY